MYCGRTLSENYNYKIVVPKLENSTISLLTIAKYAV